MSKQPRAIELADQLKERFGATVPTSQAAAELRSLHAANAELAQALEHAKAGLLWYQDRYPEATDGSDDEAMALIDEALAAHEADKQPVEDERGAFEATYSETLLQGNPIARSVTFRRDPRNPDEYEVISVQSAWAMWQARAGRASAQAVPAWQPIETAPKDYVTEFDGWNGTRVPNVSWAHPEYGAKGEYAWCVSEYETGHGWVNARVNGLTHWMPLPAAPKGD